MALSTFNISYLNILKLSTNIYLEQTILNYHSAGLVRKLIPCNTSISTANFVNAPASQIISI